MVLTRTPLIKLCFGFALYRQIENSKLLLLRSIALLSNKNWGCYEAKKCCSSLLTQILSPKLNYFPSLTLQKWSGKGPKDDYFLVRKLFFILKNVALSSFWEVYLYLIDAMQVQLMMQASCWFRHAIADMQVLWWCSCIGTIIVEKSFGSLLHDQLFFFVKMALLWKTRSSSLKKWLLSLVKMTPFDQKEKLSTLL